MPFPYAVMPLVTPRSLLCPLLVLIDAFGLTPMPPL